MVPGTGLIPHVRDHPHTPTRGDSKTSFRLRRDGFYIFPLRRINSPRSKMQKPLIFDERFLCPGLDCPSDIHKWWSYPRPLFASRIMSFCLSALTNKFAPHPNKKPYLSSTSRAWCPGLDSNQHNLADAAT